MSPVSGENPLVVEHEFAGIEDGPEGILNGALRVLLGRDQGGELVLFGLGWAATKGTNVELLDDFDRGFLFRQTAPDQIALGNTRTGRIAIEQMQRLGKIRFEADFAGANRFAGRATKGGQEVVADAAVGNLHGPGAQGQTGELVLGFGDQADAVEGSNY